MEALAGGKGARGGARSAENEFHVDIEGTDGKRKVDSLFWPVGDYCQPSGDAVTALYPW